jgi:hypothetical protein
MPKAEFDGSRTYRAIAHMQSFLRREVYHPTRGAKQTACAFRAGHCGLVCFERRREYETSGGVRPAAALVYNEIQRLEGAWADARREEQPESPQENCQQTVEIRLNFLSGLARFCAPLQPCSVLSNSSFSFLQSFATPLFSAQRLQQLFARQLADFVARQ